MSNTNLEVSSSVNVDYNGQSYNGTVVKVFKNGKVRVQASTGEQETVPADAVSPRKAGRKPKSAAQLKKEIKDLLEQLEVAEEREDQMRLRRLLRSRGHYGGLSTTKTLEEHLAEREASIKAAKGN